MSDSEKLDNKKHDSHSHPASREVKFCSQFRDLPIVSIENGEELGRVHGFLVDVKRGIIAGFILSTSAVQQGVKVAPFTAISSFGGFALTVSRSADVTDLIANPYFLELFEKDAVLLSSKVTEHSGKLVGFVQDVGIDPQSGRIVLLKIASDVGFMSPYRANIPFAAIKRIEHDTLTLREKEQITFKKDIPGISEEEYSYVPLVLKEEEIRQVLLARLVDEMEKVRRDVQKSLETEFEKYFLIHQKETMLKEITAALEKYVEETLACCLEIIRKEMTEEIRRTLDDYMIKKLEPQTDTD